MRTFLVSLALLMPVTGFAQAECEVIGQADSAFRIRIDGNIADLVSRQAYTQALTERDELRARLAETEATLRELGDLTQQYEELRNKHVTLALEYQQLAQDSLTLNTEFRDTSNELVTLTEQYSQTVKDYDELAGKYRSIALSSGRNLHFDIGVGVNNSSAEQTWDVLFGAGVFGFKGWVYGNSDRQGIAVGASF